jgi:hypothetical protein
MSERTPQLFDLMFKSIIKEASPSAIVHLINGIYKKNYPLDTPVTIEPTEFIKKHPKSGKLKKIITDIMIILYCENGKEMFLIEAQIDDDAEMILRIFNYSIFAAIENKEVSDDGFCMEIAMPAPAVIYWETSRARKFATIRIRFPDKRKSVLYKVPAFKVLQHSVFELEDMALLLPFYILKIRKELKKKGIDSARKKELATELKKDITRIDKVLKKCKRNNYITDSDAAMLLRQLSTMYIELYGKQNEFMEVDMRLEKLVKSGISELVAETEAKTESQSQIKFAKAMKAGGEAIDKIIRYTGLSRREIAAL